ncbi:hypothetical protein Nans01_10580 [Nocardiopsis ansamitocini]|uniref:Uncharacterized protein n=1 Tax=Nocardiopsis ansamitocini TaxID=1670832 RepID=A0A9W6P424_9ACTN|nr:hypothetical protein Nans01_10580 [Nocardiopsis ansamitocini]
MTAAPWTVLRVGAVVAASMTGAPRESLDTPEAQKCLAASSRKRVDVLMTVERVVSWDHSKL